MCDRSSRHKYSKYWIDCNWLLRSPLGGPIFAGLRRAFGEPGRTKPAADQRVDRAGADHARWARALGDLTIRLAANRAISPNSVTGISLLLGLCAAAWFSGGARRDDVWGLITTGAWVVVRAGARQLTERHSAGQAGERNVGWFYAVCATAGECAIYGGIAAGAQSAGWTATWPLAFAIVIVGSVAAIARTCGDAAKGAAGLRGGQTRRLRGALAALTFPPIGVQVLLAALIIVSFGPRIALVAVLFAQVVSLARNVTIAAMSAAAEDVVLACRDDGPIARRTGWLVRGNLMPVPPAVAGIVAIGLLALLGIRNLPGIVALTPVVVLLLAAPGSSHPHDGRFDWLVPVLLCLAQYSYLAVLGVAKSVPQVLVFATCSMTAVWYASVTASRAGAKPAGRTPPRRKTRVAQIMARRTEGIGWEGRVGVVGLAGMFGIATFGYLGLTVCLGALIGRKAVVDYLRQGEDQRQ